MGPFFSEDDLNPGGYAHFLTYEANGDNVTIGPAGTYNDEGHWYIATEAGTAVDTTAEDFSDFIVQLESIRFVPEPSSVMLFVIGLGAVAARRRIR